MLFIVAVVLFLLLPEPWDVVGAVVFGLLGLIEIYFWNRTVRGRRKVVGTQTLVGQTAEVRVTCRPRGQVFVAGEIWEAECPQGADIGTQVVVRGVRGLTLEVEPAP